SHVNEECGSNPPLPLRPHEKRQSFSSTMTPPVGPSYPPFGGHTRVGLAIRAVSGRWRVSIAGSGAEWAAPDGSRWASVPAEPWGRRDSKWGGWTSRPTEPQQGNARSE